MEFSAEGPMAIPMWVNGHAFLSVGDAFYDVVNPVTGEALRRVPLCGASEAGEAVAAARAAQPEWAAMGLAARQVCLGKLADGVDRYTGHFAKLLTQDLGLTEEAATADVQAAIEALRGMAVGETGVAGLVVDADRPLVRLAKALVPTLLAGGTVVVKPSPKAPSAVFALCELTSRVEWPAGVVNLLQGDTAAVTGLCGAPVDRIIYAGQPELGKQVKMLAEASGKTFAEAAF